MQLRWWATSLSTLWCCVVESPGCLVSVIKIFSRTFEIYKVLILISNLFYFISSLVEDSKQQSVLLCEGVGEMLSRGRHTCATLKSAIDGALVTLLGKTKDSPALLVL